LPKAAATIGAMVARSDGARPPAPPTFPDSRASAVLIVLVDGERGAEVLLTKRSEALRQHAGEISFPGGRLDPGENDVEAALREADEEVGLRPDDVTVVGRLSALSTVVSRSYIMPVVATVTVRPALVPHDGEVARILWVPLVELAQPDTHREERWGTPPLDRRMDFFELDDETIWGATARILRELLDVVYGPPATRTAL
jgi:8-oxo-dGTP pyrophosphatase MutT (NUDIX family)